MPSAVALHEHPPVPLEVFSPVALAWTPGLDLRKDGGAGCASTLEMSVHILDVHQNAIDDVWDLRPLRGSLASLSVVSWRLIVRRRSGKHDHSAAVLAGHHFAVAEPAIRLDHADDLVEAKCFRQPVHRRWSVLVREHRDHVRL